MVARDLPALNALLDDALIWIHSSAMVEDKTAFLARIGQANDLYLAIRRTDESIRFAGPVAIVTGIAHVHASVGGTEKALRNRFTNIWHADGSSGPRLLSCQSTKIP